PALSMTSRVRETLSPWNRRSPCIPTKLPEIAPGTHHLPILRRLEPPGADPLRPRLQPLPERLARSVVQRDELARAAVRVQVVDGQPHGLEAHRLCGGRVQAELVD